MLQTGGTQREVASSDCLSLWFARFLQAPKSTTQVQDWVIENQALWNQAQSANQFTVHLWQATRFQVTDQTIINPLHAWRPHFVAALTNGHILARCQVCLDHRNWRNSLMVLCDIRRCVKIHSELSGLAWPFLEVSYQTSCVCQRKATWRIWVESVMKWLHIVHGRVHWIVLQRQHTGTS